MARLVDKCQQHDDWLTRGADEYFGDDEPEEEEENDEQDE